MSTAAEEPAPTPAGPLPGAAATDGHPTTPDEVILRVEQIFKRLARLRLCAASICTSTGERCSG